MSVATENVSRSTNQAANGVSEKKDTQTAFEKMSAKEQEKFIDGLTTIVGKQWVETDPCILDSYAWQMNAELIGDTTHFMPRAIAIVLPEST